GLKRCLASCSAGPGGQAERYCLPNNSILGFASGSRPKPPQERCAMTIKINLNADMAEGFGAYDIGDDSGILKVIGSANIACGFHAGDPLTMRRVVEEAK